MRFHDAKAVDRIEERFLNKEITLTTGELLSIAPDFAKHVHEGTAIRRVAFRDPKAGEAQAIDEMISKIRSETAKRVTTAYVEEVTDDEEDAVGEVSAFAATTRAAAPARSSRSRRSARGSAPSSRRS